jgi:hypothetical protein
MSQRNSGKACSVCGSIFPRKKQFFHADRQKPDGLRPECKSCARLRRRRFYLRHRDRICAQTAAYGRANKARTNQRNKTRRITDPDFRLAMRKRTAKWKEENLERRRASDRDWARSNPGKNAARRALGRTSRRRATPPWLTTEQRKQMRDIYILAAKLDMHVDHIYPICGENSCGLHVPWNLQLLPPIDNLKKSNRLVPAE